MFTIACPPQVSRSARKVTVAWILWSAPTESRGADPDEDGKRRSVGAVIGSPQKLGFVFEQPLAARFALQLHGGTSFDDFAAGGRLVVQGAPVNGIYGVVGVGASTEGGWAGSVRPYVTAGVGVQAGTERLRFFGEAGPVAYLDLPGYTGVGLAFGVLGSLAPEERRPEATADRASLREHPRTRISAFAGFPYLVGLGLERQVGEHSSIAFTAGSILLASTVSVRGIYGAQDGTGFYVTGGGGAGFVIPFEQSDGGAGVFGMAGVGGRWTDSGVGVFGEVGATAIAGEKGLLPMFAGGFVFSP